MRRAFDLVTAALTLILFSPFILAAMIAIRIESKGSPVYRQQRVGKDGAPFEMLKLRTMHQGHDPVGVGTAVHAGDPRVTRVGALLRRGALDELLNFVNVVRGEMSIIGPRPTIAAQVELYNDEQRRRLEVKPGITGWAQVNGRAGIGWEERIKLDVYYVDHRSAGLDARILARTPRVLFAGAGATATGGADSELPSSWKREKTED